MTSLDGAAIVEQLLDVCAELSTDELRVLLLVAERLAKGRQRYGILNVAADQRDFCREALEEAADGLVYVAGALIQGDCANG